MKLTAQRSSHQYIGTPWEKKINTWEINLEEGEFNDSIRERFSHIVVEQQAYPASQEPEERQFNTFYKATRTNWFTSNEKKDKQKKFIIEQVTNFIQNNTHALVAQWSEQSAHN